MAGIPLAKVKEYWDRRWARQGARTVGPNNWPLEKQSKTHAERNKFIMGKVPRDKHVLDYGCGIGRFSRLFHPSKYLGVDVCESLLSIARRENPGHTFELLPAPIPRSTQFPFEVFFTATVLQHNDDDAVRGILRSLRAASGERRLVLCLYENTCDLPGKPHICFRSVERYLELVSGHFYIAKHDSMSHVIHSEKHSLIVIEGAGRGDV